MPNFNAPLRPVARPTNDAPPPSAGPSSGPPSMSAPMSRNDPTPSSRATSTSFPLDDVASVRPLVVTNPKDIAELRKILDFVRASRPALASVLEHSAVIRCDSEKVTLGYESGSFLVGQATDPNARNIVLNAIKSHYGREVPFDLETIPSRAGFVTIAQLETEQKRLRLDEMKRSIASHPLVTAAIQVLGAELKDVRLAAED